MLRKTINDWTLSDGTLIPRDVYVGVAVDAMNKAEVRSPGSISFVGRRSDPSLQGPFQDAKTFRGFRFADMKKGEEGLDSAKHHLVSLNPEYIVFGNGRHAW